MGGDVFWGLAIIRRGMSPTGLSPVSSPAHTAHDGDGLVHGGGHLMKLGSSMGGGGGGRPN